MKGWGKTHRAFVRDCIKAATPDYASSRIVLDRSKRDEHVAALDVQLARDKARALAMRARRP